MGAYTYPSIVVAGDRDRPDARRFAVPLICNSRDSWGVLDTGAPRSVATYAAAKRVGVDPETLSQDGEDTFIGGFPFPYAEQTVTLRFLPPDQQLIDDFWVTMLEGESILDFYRGTPTPAITLRDVPLRVVCEPLDRIARRAGFDHPDLSHRAGKPQPFLILGMDGLLDRLSLRTEGAESFTLAPLTE